MLPVLGHRLLLKPEAKLHQVSVPESCRMLRQVPVPEA
jgi:hypothetical protein